MSVHKHWQGVVIVAYRTNPLRVLLIKNSPSGNVTPPAGIINPGETPKQAAVRELKEETGIECADGMLQQINIFHNFTYSDGTPRDGDTASYEIFLLNADALSDPIDTEDGKEPKWVEVDDVDSEITFPNLAGKIKESLVKLNV